MDCQTTNMSLFSNKRKVRQEEQMLENVLALLKSDYGWNLYNDLTITGKKLVKDTIEAYNQCQLKLKK